MIRLVPAVAITFLTAPVLFGLVGVVLPAFGWLPVLGGDSLSLEPWRQLAAQPGIGMSVAVSLLAGLATTAIALTVVMLFLAGAGNGRVYQWV